MKCVKQAAHSLTWGVMKTRLPLAVLLCALMGLCGCSTTPKIAGANAFEAHAVHQLEQRLQSGRQGARDHQAEQQLQRLACRVDADGCPRLRVYVLAADNHPSNLTAQSYVGGMMVVNTPLLDLFPNEPERLFIIAHEMAHQALGHLPFRDGDKHMRLTLEREADAWAVKQLQGQVVRPECVKHRVLSALDDRIQDSSRRAQLNARLIVQGSVCSVSQTSPDR